MAIYLAKLTVIKACIHFTFIFILLNVYLHIKMKSTEVLNPRRGYIMHALAYIDTRMPSRYVRVTERYTEDCTCDKMADLNRGKQIML